MSYLSDFELLDTVDEYGEELTEWEIEFVESMFAVLREHKNLTRAQRAKLEQVYEDRCD